MDDQAKALLDALDAMMIFIDDANTADHSRSKRRTNEAIEKLRLAAFQAASTPAARQDQVICENCGFYCDPDWTYCPGCGAPEKQPATPQARSPAAPLPVDVDALKWLIWSNEHRCWWRPNKAGYTTSIITAGRYTFAEALSCCDTRDKQKNGTPSEMPVPAPESYAFLTSLTTTGAGNGR